MPSHTPEQPVIGPQHVKRQLLGLQTFLTSLDQEELNALLSECIGAAQGRFERELETYMTPRVIRTRPGPNDQLGVTYDVQEDPYDYPALLARWLGFFTTRRRPIISVENMAVEYGPNANQRWLLYPGTWIQIEHVLGKITLIPVGGSMIPASVGATPETFWWLPQLVGSITGGIVPDVLTIDYTAGLSDVEKDYAFSELRVALAKCAALDAFPSITSLIPTSTSRDGVSVSFGLITQMEQQLENDVTTFIREWNSEKRAFHLAVA